MPQRRSHFPNASTPLKRASESTTPSRQSKRIKSSPITSSKTTPKKSPYFEHPDSSNPESESEIEKEASGYEDEDESASLMSSPPESEVEEEEDGDASEDDAPKKRKRSRPAKSNGNGIATSAGKKGQELWRPGAKIDAAPGEAVFIKLPKARDAGKVPYTDSTIHPNTILFLKDLRANNDREWLKMHDADYRQSKKDFDCFVECLTEKVMEKDDTIPELPPKDLTFRIYRDIRFSPDPTPYKTHFSAAWSRTGRKGPYAGYYVQVQPNGSFVGAGVWHPEAPPLALMRNDVDLKSHKIKAVLTAPELRREFFGGISNDEKKAVKAFVGMNTENMLKTKPKGYEKDNPNIDLLKLRNYTIGKKLKDEEVLGPGGLRRIVELIGILKPFVSYLNGVVMPDEEPSSEDEEEEGEEGGEEEEGEGDE
ncbi:MAG: hypothetical protein ASARMPREDX12_004033 [Alectoria sarmentosa]|nr:MAG: hypothetical protein ASARMPRED_005199 [Alectoria sarmentosa]CAD6589800.1 MAG: hypothetical protein ASARMPREDX12_004033 [Alectoria sarmentosa]